MVKQEVLGLLAAQEHAESYFDGLVEEVAGSARSELQVASREQRRIGPYRTLRILGRGGMGVVLLAERVDGQFEQQVALKLVRSGMTDDAAIRRFLAERQILARLQHPGIARLLDGGISDDGLPYFVMEYVEGTPIHEYCDDRKLPIEERLRLLCSVGEAVQFAHRNLVVHRDLKPGNILVTQDGECRLLDFGIARLLDHDGDGTSTVTTSRALTPLYAAPEQIRAEAATTATDIYSLGVVLYELMTGVRPWEAEGRSAAELENEILTREPASLRSRVGPEAAERRSSSLRRLRRRLGGDLETICRKAIHKEPERRYKSMDQFVADIDRLLCGRPVVARRDTVAYRSSRFVRRHPISVAAGVGVLVLSLAFSAAMTFQSARLARERDKAQQVSDLMVDLFQVSDPANSRGESLSAREVLERGVEQLEGRLESQPEVRASLLDVTGRVYQALGLYEDAAPLLEESLALRESGAGSASEIAESLSHRGELLRLQGALDEAEETLLRALERYGALGEEGTPSYSRVLDRLGVTLLAQGKLDVAEPYFRAALASNLEVYGPESVEGAENLQNLGALSYGRGDFALAEEHFRSALVMRRSLLGEDHPQVAATLNNLGAALAAGGNLTAAEETYIEALSLQRRLLGNEHPRVLQSLNNLAMILFSSGRPAAAEPLHREALAIRRRVLEPSHPERAQSLSNLGLVLQSLGELEESEKLLRESLEVRRAALGPSHPLIAHSLNNLGLLLLAKGSPEESEELFREALAIVEPTLGKHLDVATSLNNLGTSLEQLGRDDEAEASYRRALDIRREVLPSSHPHLAFNLLSLGRLLSARGRAQEAEPLLREALTIRQETQGAATGAITEARVELAACLASLGRHDEAKALSAE